jgi:hypothetical protein
LQAAGGGGLGQAHLLEVWFRLRSWATNRCLKSWSVAAVVAGGRRCSMIRSFVQLATAVTAWWWLTCVLARLSLFSVTLTAAAQPCNLLQEINK